MPLAWVSTTSNLQQSILVLSVHCACILPSQSVNGVCWNAEQEHTFLLLVATYLQRNGLEFKPPDRLLSYLPLAHIFDRCV